MAIGTVCTWIGVGVAYFSSAIARAIASLRPKSSKEVNEELSVCAWADRCAMRCGRRLRVERDTPRDLRCRENQRASQKPFDGYPYTRLARAQRASKCYMGDTCVRFKAWQPFDRPCGPRNDGSNLVIARSKATHQSKSFRITRCDSNLENGGVGRRSGIGVEREQFLRMRYAAQRVSSDRNEAAFHVVDLGKCR
jgi:hypothetical protein